MARTTLRRWDAFGIVGQLARDWPDIDAATKYDGSPVLKCRGCFMAGMAGHASAEPDTLVARIDVEARAGLVDDAPEAYYLTAYYAPHPVVLVRLARLDRHALHDLLAMARRATLLKATGSRPTSAD